MLNKNEPPVENQNDDDANEEIFAWFSDDEFAGVEALRDLPSINFLFWILPCCVTVMSHTAKHKLKLTTQEICRPSIA
jgi:hypothetical protein